MSSDCLREALSGFIYTAELKEILKNSQQMSHSDIYATYFPAFCQLKELCPKRKAEDYAKIKEIFEGYNPSNSKAEKAKDEEE